MSEQDGPARDKGGKFMKVEGSGDSRADGSGDSQVNGSGAPQVQGNATKAPSGATVPTLPAVSLQGMSPEVQLMMQMLMKQQETMAKMIERFQPPAAPPPAAASNATRLPPLGATPAMTAAMTPVILAEGTLPKHIKPPLNQSSIEPTCIFGLLGW